MGFQPVSPRPGAPVSVLDVPVGLEVEGRSQDPQHQVRNNLHVLGIAILGGQSMYDVRPMIFF